MNGRFEKTDIAGPDVQTQIKRHRAKLAADLQALIDNHTLWLDTTVEEALKLLQREEKESEPDFLHGDHIVVRVPDWAKPTPALIESRRRLTERYRKVGEKEVGPMTGKEYDLKSPDFKCACGKDYVSLGSDGPDCEDMCRAKALGYRVVDDAPIDEQRKHRVAKLLVEAGNHVQDAENAWDREERDLGTFCASTAIDRLKTAIQIMSGEREE